MAVARIGVGRSRNTGCVAVGIAITWRVTSRRMVMTIVVPEMRPVRLRVVLAIGRGACPHRLQRQQDD